MLFSPPLGLLRVCYPGVSPSRSFAGVQSRPCFVRLSGAHGLNSGSSGFSGQPSRPFLCSPFSVFSPTIVDRRRRVRSLKISASLYARNCLFVVPEVFLAHTRWIDRTCRRPVKYNRPTRCSPPLCGRKKARSVTLYTVPRGYGSGVRLPATTTTFFVVALLFFYQNLETNYLLLLFLVAFVLGVFRGVGRKIRGWVLLGFYLE